MRNAAAGCTDDNRPNQEATGKRKRMKRRQGETENRGTVSSRFALFRLSPFFLFTRVALLCTALLAIGP